MNFPGPEVLEFFLMSPRKNTKVSAERRRELQVAAAVAREALLQVHVARGLELIALAGNRISVIRMLDIYARVNMLSTVDAELVATRLLAALGNGPQNGDKPLVYVEGEDSATGERRFLGVVRDRLRGRIFNDLRRWVELHTGTTQVALLDMHVQHALRFVDMLRDTHTIAAALQVYAELVNVPKGLTDTLYIMVLDRLAAQELPAAGVRVPDAQQIPLFPSSRQRVV